MMEGEKQGKKEGERRERGKEWSAVLQLNPVGWVLLTLSQLQALTHPTPKSL